MYDVIVVGAGHAGCEAALAAARIGARTLLLTMNLDLIAQMPCNPSIGGPGKGHLVREIDALGGQMGRAIDANFIQIRLLNQTKGPAVQALRAQADKRRYSLQMKHTLEAAPNLHLKQARVEELLVRDDRVTGVRVDTGAEYAGRAVVLTTGTFLAAQVMRGRQRTPAGRAGEFPANALSESLKRLGIDLARLQTNTPPRVDARTIDFDQTVLEPGSETPLYFSFDSARAEADEELRCPHFLRQPPNPIYPHPYLDGWRPQLPCYSLYTNAETHRVVRENLDRSQVTPGAIEAAGPRYCPSFEEKLVRFPDKERHLFFLEPEGWDTGEMYVQGLFTGMPEEVQLAALRTMLAMHQVEIVRPGYAIEYDAVISGQFDGALASKRIEGLYTAGQINGTSGYEEAAAQGLIAGINAALSAGRGAVLASASDATAGRGAVIAPQSAPLGASTAPLQLRRDQAYIGVLIDDLVTKPQVEPYRVFTSRAEYRLLLRQDNADLRLTPLGYQVGLVSRARYEVVERKRQAIQKELARLEGTWLPPGQEVNAALAAAGIPAVDDGVNVMALLRRPGVSYALIRDVAPLPPSPTADGRVPPVRTTGGREEGWSLPPEVVEQVEIEAKYAGYIARQQAQVDKMARLEARRMPPHLEYEGIPGLRAEAREQLLHYRPLTLGQAARLPGVTPADVVILMVHLERRDHDR